MSPSTTIFVVVIIVVVVALVLWIASISRRAQRLSNASDERLAAQLQDVAKNLPPTTPFEVETSAQRSAQVIAMATDDENDPSSVATPAATKESRLAEVMDLHSRGLISDEELATARAKILAE
jgi:predicted PurR-regulated permease PerM